MEEETIFQWGLLEDMAEENDLRFRVLMGLVWKVLYREGSPLQPDLDSTEF